MLPWWGWVLLWVVLVVGGLGVCALLARRVWGRARALLRELGDAERLVGALETRTDRIRAEVATTPVDLAIFSDPAQVGAARRATRRTVADERAVRREERLPGWARTVH